MEPLPGNRVTVIVAMDGANSAVREHYPPDVTITDTDAPSND
jgi:uncharacterized Rossmann fold enzyme